jgi:hypothetical protein
MLLKNDFQRCPALFEVLCEKRLARLEQQAIEDDEGRRRFVGQPLDAAFGGVQSHLQRVE